MRKKGKRMIASLLSLLLLLPSATVFATDGDVDYAQQQRDRIGTARQIYESHKNSYAENPGQEKSMKAKARSAGETIYSQVLQSGVSDITVTQYPEGGGYNVVKTWSEGILGADTGERLYCADPTASFKEGYKTAVPAENYFPEYTVNFIGALMYWYDNNMCAGVNDTDDYLFKQEMVWTIANMEKNWYADVLFEHGNGTSCDWGHDTYAHREELFVTGMAWAAEHINEIKTEAFVFEGEGQPLIRVNYFYNPTGWLNLKKVSANPELTDNNGCYSLDGAVYGVYPDRGCTSEITTLVTDASGDSNAVELDAGTYYVKEKTAPKGYALDPRVYTVTVTSGQTATLDVRDIPQSDPVAVLLGKIDRETTQNMPQGSASLEGAEFTVKYYDGFYDTDPAEAGEQPVRTWVFATNENGFLYFDEPWKVSGDDFWYTSYGFETLPLGTITIQETKAPAGYLLNDEIFVRKIMPGGTSEGVDTYNEPEVPESVIRGGVRIEKWDHETGKNEAQGSATLEGAKFQIISDNDNPVMVNGKIYQKGEAVKTITTDKTGAASTAADELPHGDYIAKEQTPPPGYNLSGVTERRFSIRENGKIVNLNTADTAIRDNVIRGGVRVEKWDNETAKHEAQGAATLEGAEFTITTLNDQPVVVNGKSYGKGKVVKTLVTDRTGTAETGPRELPHGHYLLKETKAPEGYNLSGVLEREFWITEDGKTVQMTTASTAIRDDVIRGDLQIVKFVEDLDQEEDQKTPLEGIIFMITSKTTGKSWEIVTDEYGYANTRQLGISDRGNLVYDTYVVSEKNTPPGLKPVKDFEITISKEGQTLYYILEDKQILSPVQLYKSDSTTNRLIPMAGTEFQLLDENKDPVTMTTHYPSTEVHYTFKTDESGTFTLPEKLPVGIYYFREVNAPEGYLRGKDLKFEIKEGHDWSEPFVVEYADEPAMGRIEIVKTDSGTGDVLSGAEFEIRAAEDIITPDGTVRVEKGKLVDTITTDNFGRAQSKDLYLGKYVATETKQPPGYVLPDQGWTVELTYQDQDTAVVIGTLRAGNDQTTLIIDKKETGSDKRLPGVEFRIWNKAMAEDGTDPGFAAGETYVTDENGQIRLERLEAGDYCVAEAEGIPGYEFDPEKVYEFTVTEDGRIDGSGEHTLTVENARTQITETNAVDVSTGTQSAFPLKDVTITDTVSIVHLQPGEDYVVRGVLADQLTGQPLRENNSLTGDELTAEQEFTAADGSMDVEVTFHADLSAFAGRKIVVYEYLYQDGVEISVHNDPNDERQQIQVTAPELHTTAVDVDSGTHEAVAKEDITIRDTVEYSGIIPGLTYTLKGIVMDRATEKPLLIDGKEVTAEKEVTVSDADGEISMEFTFDASELNNTSVVIYEYLYYGDELAASHEDITDKNQTVTFKVGSLSAELPDGRTSVKTGDDAASAVQGLLLMLAGAALVIITVLWSKRRTAKTVEGGEQDEG